MVITRIFWQYLNQGADFMTLQWGENMKQIFLLLQSRGKTNSTAMECIAWFKMSWKS